MMLYIWINYISKTIYKTNLGYSNYLEILEDIIIEKTQYSFAMIGEDIGEDIEYIGKFMEYSIILIFVISVFIMVIGLIISSYMFLFHK